MDYTKNRKYFTKSDKTAAIAIIAIGVVCGITFIGVLAFGFAFHDMSYLLYASIPLLPSVIACVTGVILWKEDKKFKNIPDSEYDSEVNKYIDGLKMRALEYLGIDEDEVNEIKPIEISGYLGSFVNKVGSDGVLRTNRINVAKIFFSANEIHIYKNTFCTTKEEQNESTEVYFYNDIVSVTTVEEKEKIGNTEFKVNSFVITTAGGTSFKGAFRDVGYANRSINAMRALLREKKKA